MEGDTQYTKRALPYIMALNKTKHTSHIQSVRRQMEDARQSVQSCLRWSHMEYCEYQFEQYVLFADLLTEGWPRVREQILYSPLFRGFWNNQWLIRDKADFLPFAMEMDARNISELVYMREEYLFLHSAHRLIEEDDFMRAYNQVLKLL